MPQPSDALDLRRADEGVLLDALEVGHPLALAEAYHRSVPAAHAVARRLMSTTDDIESLLHDAYAQLWASPPTAGPLEGWMRRTVWTLGIDRLRADGTAPASPSLAGLVPDLPAPDVRFLDAAERAIAELPDEQRRALLLAHDKGVPTSAQEPGAARALARALGALAGAETSTADRTSLQEDGCEDLDAVGDWCLGLATSREEAEVDLAIEQRAGCAAMSRAARRGRRRVEGLPATPDMGQRILVSVLTAGSRPLDATRTGTAGMVSSASPADEDAADTDASRSGDASRTAGLDAPGSDPGTQDPFAPLDETGPLPTLDEDPYAPTTDDDPFGPPGNDDPFAPAGDDPFAPPGDDDPFAPAGDDPFADLGDAAASTDDLEAVTDTTDLPAVDAPADDRTAADGQRDADPVDWRPDPGSTAEMRLSDILAEGDDDDPFADLDDDDGDRPGDPYRALRGLDEDDPSPVAARDATMTAPVGEDADLIGGYVEGQEGHDLVDAGGHETVGVGGPSRTAALLAWILPILGGSAIGILIAITVFGPPA